jgi:hypothetical protein
MFDVHFLVSPYRGQAGMNCHKDTKPQVKPLLPMVYFRAEQLLANYINQLPQIRHHQIGFQAAAAGIICSQSQ